jgi:peptidoglycan/LPS O-acetylase OafA/YrhL
VRAEEAGRVGNSFDFLRLFFAGMVIFSHSYAFLRKAEPLGRWSHQTDAGAFAVASFFIISGYLIMASWERSRSPLEYLRKRVFRIYPAYVTSVLVVAFVVAPLSTYGLTHPRFGWGEIANCCATLKKLEYPPGHRGPWAFQGTPSLGLLNNPAWTIRYEFQCYLFIMLIGLVGLHRKRWTVLALFVVSLGLSFAVARRWIVGPPRGLTTTATPNLHAWASLAPPFLAGMVAWLYRDKIRYHWAGALACLAVLVAGTWKGATWTVLVPTAWAYIVFWFGGRPRGGLEKASKYGDFSYGTYLYACPVQAFVMMLYPKVTGFGVQPWALFCISLPIAIAVGAISYWGVERWFLKHKVARRAAAAPVAAVARSDAADGREDALQVSTHG